jgi:GntR family transcriptional repressor for pyruvate dehydrogenase complex
VLSIASCAIADAACARVERHLLKVNTRQRIPVPSPVRRTRLVTLILDQLRQYVIMHGLVEGDRLPPERELATQLKVSRPTLRAALDWLNQRGVLRRVQGGGTFVRANLLSVLAQSADNANAGDDKLHEVIEARRLLEPILIRLATKRASDTDLETLRKDVEQIAAQAENAEAWFQHDLQFHIRLSRLAENTVLSGSMESLLAPVFSAWIANCPEFDLARALSEHRAIVAAMLRRDGDKAIRLSAAHLEQLEHVVRASSFKASA